MEKEVEEREWSWREGSHHQLMTISFDDDHITIISSNILLKINYTFIARCISSGWLNIYLKSFTNSKKDVIAWISKIFAVPSVMYIGMASRRRIYKCYYINLKDYLFVQSPIFFCFMHQQLNQHRRIYILYDNKTSTLLEYFLKIKFNKVLYEY